MSGSKSWARLLSTTIFSSSVEGTGYLQWQQLHLSDATSTWYFPLPLCFFPQFFQWGFWLSHMHISSVLRRSSNCTNISKMLVKPARVSVLSHFLVWGCSFWKRVGRSTKHAFPAFTCVQEESLCSSQHRVVWKRWLQDPWLLLLLFHQVSHILCYR